MSTATLVHPKAHHFSSEGSMEREQSRSSAEVKAEEVDMSNISTSRLSSSERRSERPSRARAKKGTLRDLSSDSEDYEGPRRKRGERRGLSDSKQKKNLSDFSFERPDPITAAKNKANRERQRRERLNDSFADLVKTLDPDGSVKGEKTSIIAGTIKAINTIRKENEKLKREKAEIEKQRDAAVNSQREAEFERAMIEQQLQSMRSGFNFQPVHQSLGSRAELAGQIEGLGHSPQASPSGLSRMFQEQAAIHSNGQQAMSALSPQMFAQNGHVLSQSPQSSYVPLMSAPLQNQPIHPTGNGNFNPNNQHFAHRQQVFNPNEAAFNGNGDFLDIDPILGSSLPDINPDVMSMSPILWLNESLGPEADESYMCSNL